MSELSLDAITPDSPLPMQNNMQTVTKKYWCQRPYEYHYFFFTWVVGDKNSTVRWECPVCGLPQTLERDAQT